MERGDYHVGWICALPTERAAAQSMLDETHPALARNRGDNNAYAYGRIGAHNVVIACLPAGVYGTTSAANVAQNMRRSFPNINIGLMVGVGGGIPTRTNGIRLGDVVVSKPTNASGGVVQFDMGRSRPDDLFELTGSLNRPPDVLLNALGALMARYELQGSDIPRLLQESIQQNPNRSAYATYPSTALDQLFDSAYNHPGEDGDCEDCDLGQVVNRPPRQHAYPIVHHGTIASGNQVVRDGSTRDRIRQQIGAMCFEMEASGLMDSFPCLVIRGICDYADSHKNKQWQSYAASVAAAYAKELLGMIDPEEVDESPAREQPPPRQSQRPDSGQDRSTDRAAPHQGGGPKISFNNYGDVGNQVGYQTNHGPLYFGTVSHNKPSQQRNNPQSSIADALKQLEQLQATVSESRMRDGAEKQERERVIREQMENLQRLRDG
ncbi:Hypothetical protein D9617_2g055540 [Elsinoe fawcettii]|nr:Hypothetical protein D9617_2g055540 [Elsinoe fawcettii]